MAAYQAGSLVTNRAIALEKGQVGKAEGGHPLQDTFSCGLVPIHPFCLFQGQSSIMNSEEQSVNENLSSKSRLQTNQPMIKFLVISGGKEAGLALVFGRFI